MKIPITKPFFDEKEKRAVADCLERGWVVQGPKVREFEELFAQWTKAKFAKATTSCTTALHLSLLACGIKEGDEVIVPSFTFVATANAVCYISAKPIFVDIDIRTYNIDVEKIEKAITPRTRAIIPVHLFGLSSDMAPILEIAKKYNLKIIEDAACATGSFYNDKHVGVFGDAGCFSFHPRKAITTGEGGMITTNNPEIDEKILSLRDHGASIPDWQRHLKKGYLLPEYDIVGYNYRMTDIQASIGCEQMRKCEKILERRRFLANRYNELLSCLSWIKIPFVPDNCIHGYQSYVCLFLPDEPSSSKKVEKMHKMRNKLMDILEEKGIATRQGTHAVHTLGYYQKTYSIKETDYFNSYVADRLTITLPLYYNLSEEEQNWVIKQIKDSYKKCVE